MLQSMHCYGAAIAFTGVAAVFAAQKKKEIPVTLAHVDPVTKLSFISFQATIKVMPFFKVRV